MLSLCFAKIFKFPVFSLTGNLFDQFPCFPCAMGTQILEHCLRSCKVDLYNAMRPRSPRSKYSPPGTWPISSILTFTLPLPLFSLHSLSGMQSRRSRVTGSMPRQPNDGRVIKGDFYLSPSCCLLSHVAPYYMPPPLLPPSAYCPLHLKGNHKAAKWSYGSKYSKLKKH